MEPTESGRRMGHEFIGIVEAAGADVRTIKTGDLVVSPFLWSDGSCVFCQEGLQSVCLHGGRYGFDDVDGGQGEAVRVPQADGTLVVLPVSADDALMPSLLTLADVMGTGHHAAVAAGAGRCDRPGRLSPQRHRSRPADLPAADPDKLVPVADTGSDDLDQHLVCGKRRRLGHLEDLDGLAERCDPGHPHPLQRTVLACPWGLR